MEHPVTDSPGAVREPQGAAAGRAPASNLLFTTAFADLGLDATLMTPWSARSTELGTKPLAPERGAQLMQALWEKDKFMSRLGPQAVGRMQPFFDFCKVKPDCDIIRQDEYGNFMVVLLSGTIAVDRMQPWGERLRLAETRPGEILGEMSLLDSGMRFSACTTVGECEIGVLSADAMDDMMLADPPLAANLIALLARKLSLRLRVVSARLSEQK